MDLFLHKITLYRSFHARLILICVTSKTEAEAQQPADAWHFHQRRTCRSSTQFQKLLCCKTCPSAELTFKLHFMFALGLIIPFHEPRSILRRCMRWYLCHLPRPVKIPTLVWRTENIGTYAGCSQENKTICSY